MTGWISASATAGSEVSTPAKYRFTRSLRSPRHRASSVASSSWSSNSGLEEPGDLEEARIRTAFWMEMASTQW
jgi:hypothetical protein